MIPRLDPVQILTHPVPAPVLLLAIRRALPADAPGEEALSIKVDNKLLHATLSSGRPIVNLDLGGKTIRKCIIKEVQVDPLSDELIHVDLMGIKMDKPLDISLPVHLTGDSIGVSVSGGVVQQPRAALPERLEHR